jgi:hypothetical protein
VDIRDDLTRSADYWRTMAQKKPKKRTPEEQAVYDRRTQEA